jgi:streptogramin lyase
MGRDRVLAFGAVAAVAVGVLIAVVSAFTASASSATRSVDVGGATVRVTEKPGGTVCYAGPGVSSCSRLADSQLAYATGRVGGRVVLGGVAGPGVKAVIARLTRQGTVWPALRDGVFYAVLPDGHRLRAIVKVLAGGRRVTFSA